MKRFTRWLCAGAVAAALLCGGALAAGDQSVVVQLNGENLTFTDAAPQIRDSRTFLPFRAVFEAMGAQVNWSADAPDQVSARRNGTEVTMTLGSGAATVVKHGVSSIVNMDVAPFAENGHTYVPVRFAAQALGCTVGWDQQAYTAIIVDTGKLIDASMEGKSFTYLEKFNELTRKYNEGVWNAEIKVDGAAGLMGMKLPMAATAQTIVSDSTRIEMAMNMTMDMSAYEAGMLQDAQSAGVPDAGLSPEEKAALDALAQEGVTVALRGDLAAGKLYMNMAGKLLEDSGMSAGNWVMMDMKELLEGSGVGLEQMLEMSRNIDYKLLAESVLADVNVSSAATGYADVKALVEKLAAAFCDDAFFLNPAGSNNYTARFEQELDGMSVSLGLSLNMVEEIGVPRSSSSASHSWSSVNDTNKRMTAFNVSLGVTGTVEGMPVSMTMAETMNDKGELHAVVIMDLAGLMTMDMNLSGAYTKGDREPQTQPPAGAAVVDMNTFMGVMPLE